MSKSVKIELNSAGIQQLLKSAEIAGVCERQAARMSAAAGVPYVADVHVGKTRVNARNKEFSKNTAQLAKKYGVRTTRDLTVKLQEKYGDNWHEHFD